jgi:hypothetical protein
VIRGTLVDTVSTGVIVMVMKRPDLLCTQDRGLPLSGDDPKAGDDHLDRVSTIPIDTIDSPWQPNSTSNELQADHKIRHNMVFSFSFFLDVIFLLVTMRCDDTAPLRASDGRRHRRTSCRMGTNLAFTSRMGWAL